MRRDATRNHETIVTAAIGILAASPEASMQEIAEASGAGRSTLYRHFPDRAALVDAIHARVVAEADGIVESRGRHGTHVTGPPALPSREERARRLSDAAASYAAIAAELAIEPDVALDQARRALTQNS